MANIKQETPIKREENGTDRDDSDEDDEIHDSSDHSDGQDSSTSGDEEEDGQEVTIKMEVGGGETTEDDEDGYVTSSDVELEDHDGLQCPRSPEGVDKCPICLNSLVLGQDIGTPISCPDAHHFCLDCIEEWSSNVNTCPVDRKEFNVILVQRGLGGPVIERLSVANRTLILCDDPTLGPDDEDVTFCEICGRCDHEDTLLLCDGCDFGYHCHCLSPPLSAVPIEEWYCAECASSDRIDLLSRHRRRNSRRIARTQTAELVRTTIERRRMASELVSVAAATGSADLTSVIDAVASGIAGEVKMRVGPARSSVKPRKRRATKKRRKTTKRKRTYGKSTSGTTVSGRKTTVKRKVTKRRKKGRRGKSRRSAASFRALAAPNNIIRNRIANKLGIEKKKVLGPHSLPIIRRPPPVNLSLSRDTAGISTLSVFGREMPSHGAVPMRGSNFGHYGIDEGDDDGSGVCIGGLVGQGRLVRSGPNINIKASLVAATRQVAAPSAADLLGSILANQEMLHTDSRNVTIGRDGSLKLARGTGHPRRPSSGAAVIAGGQKAALSGSDSNESKPNASPGTREGGEQSPSKRTLRNESPQSGGSLKQSRSSPSGTPLLPLLTPPNAQDFLIVKPTPGCGRKSPKRRLSEDNKEGKVDSKGSGVERESVSDHDDGVSGPEMDIYSDIEDATNGASDDLEPVDLVLPTNVSKVAAALSVPAELVGTGGDSTSSDNKLVIDDVEVADEMAADVRDRDVKVEIPDVVFEGGADKSATLDGLPIKRELLVKEEVDANQVAAKQVDAKTNDSLVSERLQVNSAVASGGGLGAALIKDEGDELISDQANEQELASDELDDGGGDLVEDGGDGVKRLKRIKRCKHGKILTKKKKAALACGREGDSLKVTTDISDIVEEHKLTDDEEDPVVVDEADLIGLGVEKMVADVTVRLIGGDELDGGGEVDKTWKKMTKSPAKRSYRDGKPKDVDTLFQETSGRVETSSSCRAGHEKRPRTVARGVTSRDLKTDDRRDRERPARGDRRGQRDRSRSRSRSPTRRRHEDEGDRGYKSTSRPRPAVDELDVDRKARAKHSHHRHRHSSSTSKKISVAGDPAADPVTSGHDAHGGRNKKRRKDEEVLLSKQRAVKEKIIGGHEVGAATAAVPLVDTKKIYADGDKIMVNVNFNVSGVASTVPCVATTVGKGTSRPKDTSGVEVNGDVGKLTAVVAGKEGQDDKGGSLPKLKSKSRTEFDIFFDDESSRSSKKSTDTATGDRKSGDGKRPVREHSADSKSAAKMTTSGPRTPPELDKLQNSTNNEVSSPDAPTPTLDESLEVDSLLEAATTATTAADGSNLSLKSPPLSPVDLVKSHEKGRKKSSTAPVERFPLEAYDPESPVDSPTDNGLDMDFLNKEPGNKGKGHGQVAASRQPPSSSNPAVTSLANTLAGLMKMTAGPAPGVPQPAPNSLLAQIQQTMSARGKSGVTGGSAATVQTNQLQHLLAGILLKANLTGSSGVAGATSDTATGLGSSLKRASELAQQGKLNLGISSAMTGGAGQFKRPHQPAAPTSTSSSRQSSQQHTTSGHGRSSAGHHHRSSSTASSSSTHTTSSSHHRKDQVTKVSSVTPSSSAALLLAANAAGGGENDDVPSSAVDMANKERYIKKLNRQERVIEEVKMVLKPYYQRRELTKDEYKEIMRKAVPKICHSKTGEINPLKVRALVDTYIKQYKKARKRKSGGGGGSGRRSRSRGTSGQAGGSAARHKGKPTADFDWLPRPADQASGKK